MNFDLNISPNFSTSPKNLPFDLNNEPFEEEEEGGEGDNTSVQENGIHGITHLDEVINQETTIDTEVPIKKKNRILSGSEQRAIHAMLLQKSNDGKLKKGVTMAVASTFSVPIRTIQRLWKRSKFFVPSEVPNKRKNCGRKKMQIDNAHLLEVPLHNRRTLKSLACSMSISKTKVFNLLKEGAIRRHSNSIKPLLTDENKKARLRFCISMLDENSLPHDPIFKGMYNIIHIDEKWFYMSKQSETYYLLRDEEDPIRTCKNKNFIEKVMFLVAIARPRFDAEGNEVFSGKIGIWPFVTQEPARRSSVNRVAGTIETKPITSVTREIMRTYMIEKLIPAIKEKWPRDELRYPIFIQQDNARTHINHNDIGFCETARQEGLDIRLMCQPANSPDLNVLDLGFFCAIQSLQYTESPKTVDQLVHAVVKSYENFSTMRSNHIFLTLQLCMIEIIKARGHHKYKIPHINKTRLESMGELPVNINCNPELVQYVLQVLSEGN